jgi:uncharacterized phage protein gp47/JayE
MTGTTSVPQIQWLPTGPVAPQESALLAGCQADTSAAFGGNLNPALNTPQGQLCSSWAGCIGASNDLFIYFVSQVDPDTAANFMQDAIARIYFLTRNPGLPTAVQCVCTGLPGTVISMGAQASDTSGNLYLCQEEGTIPGSGSITLPFANIVNGPIACPANTLTNIYQSIVGWSGVTNPLAGVPGANVETQAAFAYRRQQSVAINAQGSPPAIQGAVFNVPGVIDCYVVDNPLGSTVLYGATNYALAPNSVYVGVTGGSAQAIAQAIWTKKNGGCNYNGNQTVVVQDTSNYEIPYPSYNVLFNIPTPTAVLFAVQIQASPSLPSNIVFLVQTAILNSFYGTDGSQRARIGAQILAAKFYAPVILIGPQVSVLDISIGLTSPTLDIVTMGIDQQPTCIAANIVVTLV